VPSARTIQARISPDLWSWLERYRTELGSSRSAVVVDALELLRLDEQADQPRRDYWALLHQLRDELWRSQAQLPVPVSERLDSLVHALRMERGHGGGSVVRGSNRRELIAALIYDAPTSRHALAAKVKRYRGGLAGALREP
jgi:hypothetical protein